MSSVYLLHGTPGAKKRFLLALGVPGLLLALFAPWLWLNLMGGVILVVMAFFAGAFAWERDHPTRPTR